MWVWVASRPGLAGLAPMPPAVVAAQRHRDHVIRLTSFTSLGLRHWPYVIGIPSSSLRHPPYVILLPSSALRHLDIFIFDYVFTALRHLHYVIGIPSSILRHSPYVTRLTSSGLRQPRLRHRRITLLELRHVHLTSTALRHPPHDIFDIDQTSSATSTRTETSDQRANDGHR